MQAYQRGARGTCAVDPAAAMAAVSGLFKGKGGRATIQAWAKVPCVRACVRVFARARVLAFARMCV